MTRLDFHAHILPGCDHGSRDLDTSLRQLELAAQAGAQTVCATPHFYPDRDTAESFLERREKCAAELKAALPETAPGILLGAEVLVCPGIDRLDGLERLCIEGTDYLLIEMPFFKWDEELIDTVGRLAHSGRLSPVLAHADRYPEKDVEKLIDMGIPLQLNAESLCKRFGKGHLLKWLDEGRVLAIGSDIHGVKTGYKYWRKCEKYFAKLSLTDGKL